MKPLEILVERKPESSLSQLSGLPVSFAIRGPFGTQITYDATELTQPDKIRAPKGWSQSVVLDQGILLTTDPSDFRNTLKGLSDGSLQEFYREHAELAYELATPELRGYFDTANPNLDFWASTNEIFDGADDKTLGELLNTLNSLDKTEKAHFNSLDGAISLFRDYLHTFESFEEVCEPKSTASALLLKEVAEYIVGIKALKHIKSRHKPSIVERLLLLKKHLSDGDKKKAERIISSLYQPHLNYILNSLTEGDFHVISNLERIVQAHEKFVAEPIIGESLKQRYEQKLELYQHALKLLKELQNSAQHRFPDTEVRGYIKAKQIAAADPAKASELAAAFQNAKEQFTNSGRKPEWLAFNPSGRIYLGAPNMLVCIKYNGEYAGVSAALAALYNVN